MYTEDVLNGLRRVTYRWRRASVYFIDHHLTGPGRVALGTHLGR
jgi:hypothetical protein